MDQLPVDLLWRVRGDCLHAGHGWTLYAALKSVATQAISSLEVRIGPIEGTRAMRRGLLSIHRETTLRIRAPFVLLEGLLCLDGLPLRVGAHQIMLTDPVVRPLKAAPVLYAECVTFSFCKPGQDRQCPRAPTPGPDWWGNLTRLLGPSSAAGWKITPGRRRKLQLKGPHWQLGFPAEIRGLTPEQSIAIQATPIGGRRHMGAGMFRPGPLPRWLHASAAASRPRRTSRRRDTPSAGGEGRCSSITGACGVA